jgi:hypothetical protein
LRRAAGEMRACDVSRGRVGPPYRLTFDDIRITLVEFPHSLEGRAKGEFQGSGAWRLTAQGGWTRVRYDWMVTTVKAWMNLTRPNRPSLFAWNHVVMDWGAQGLARRLGCEVRILDRH